MQESKQTVVTHMHYDWASPLLDIDPTELLVHSSGGTHTDAHCNGTCIGREVEVEAGMGSHR